jgi:thiol-disulfide isomerase/thioredoxin
MLKPMKYVFVLFLLVVATMYSQELPKPIKTYSKEGIVLKSFDFDRLEPYLNRKNDTLYVYNFWATWCLPCIEELPYFEQINSKYAGDKFKMTLVSLDFPKMAESRVIPFIGKKNLKAEVVLLNDPNANSWIEKVDKNWSGAIPATLIVYGDKRLFFEKSFTLEELEKEITSLLN